MLLQLSRSLSNLSLAQDLLSKQSKTLLESDSKLRVDSTVKSIVNLISLHNFQVLHLIEDLLVQRLPAGENS